MSINEPPPQRAVAERLGEKYLQWIFSRHSLKLVSKSYRVSEKIEQFSFVFEQSQQVTDVEQTRQLIVPLIDKFIQLVANDTAAHPYLVQEDTEKLLTIHLMLVDRFGELQKSPLIAGALLVEGDILYVSLEPNAPMLKTVHEETYQEALERLGEARATEN